MNKRPSSLLVSGSLVPVFTVVSSLPLWLHRLASTSSDDLTLILSYVIVCNVIESHIIYNRLGERIVMLIGIIFLLLGPVALYPYGGPLPPFKCAPNETGNSSNTCVIFTNQIESAVGGFLVEITTVAPSKYGNSHPLYFPDLLYKDSLYSIWNKIETPIYLEGEETCLEDGQLHSN